MSKTRMMVVLAIFGLSVLVVLDNAKTEEQIQSKGVVSNLDMLQPNTD